MRIYHSFFGNFMLLLEEYLPWPLNPFFPTQKEDLTNLVYYGLLGLAEETTSYELERASQDIIAFETQLADVRMFTQCAALQYMIKHWETCLCKNT